MKKHLSIILAVCLVASLCGNLYLYNQLVQATDQIAAIQGELQTLTESSAGFEQDVAEAKAELNAELEKKKAVETELAELKRQAEEQKKADDTGIPDGGNVLPDGSIDNSGVVKPETPSNGNSNVNEDGTIPEETPSSDNKIGTKVPGADKTAQKANLKPGEAMNPQGNYVDIDKMYELCYANINGILYKMMMGKLKPSKGGGVSQDILDMGNAQIGGDWTQG